MAEQKTPDKENTDKGYDEAAHTPWVSGTDAPRSGTQSEDEDEAEQSGLSNAPRSNDPTGLQGPADNETGAG